MLSVRTSSNAVTKTQLPRSRNGVLARSGIRPSAEIGRTIAPHAGWDDDELVTTAYNDKPESPASSSDGDERVTNVLNPRPRERQLVSPTDSAWVVSRRRPVWRVGMLLHGEELTRLWAENARRVAGRFWVWSEHSKQWVPVRGPLPSDVESHRRSADDPPAIDYPVLMRSEPPLARVPVAVDVTQHASLMPDLSYRAYLPWLASAAVAVGIACLWMNRSSDLSPELLEWALAQESQRRPLDDPSTTSHHLASASRGPEVVAAEALPLVRRRERATSDVQLPIADVPEPSMRGPFKPNLARRALETAAGRARPCALGPVSGTILVTFSPAGNVTNVQLSSATGQFSDTACLLGAFRSARVSPFSGDEVTVRKSFVLGS